MRTLEQAICECTRKAEANRELAKYNKSHVDRANDLKNAEECEQLAAWLRELKERRKGLGIVRCKNCIYYDPPHVENNGVRYEYAEMPKEAFDELGTGLVNVEYGINVGGRCTRDYNTGYDDDKRVYVPENNYCGRAERRTE